MALLFILYVSRNDNDKQPPITHTALFRNYHASLPSLSVRAAQLALHYHEPPNRPGFCLRIRIVCTSHASTPQRLEATVQLFSHFSSPFSLSSRPSPCSATISSRQSRQPYHYHTPLTIFLFFILFIIIFFLFLSDSFFFMWVGPRYPFFNRNSSVPVATMCILRNLYYE